MRRKHTITVGYELDTVEVEKTLLEATSKVELVLKNPKPYVRITEFGNFAAEYTLYVFINQIKKIQEIDSDVRRTVLQACKEQGIDLSTPNLIRNLK